MFMKILICEERDILLTTLEFRLSRRGFDVIRAVDGGEALEKLKTEAPDLLVTDLDTPGLSGMDLLSTLRGELNETIPVIIVGSADRGEDLLAALKKGASDFVTRPFKPLELILRIQWILRQPAN